MKQHKIELGEQYGSITGNITINHFRSGLKTKYADIAILAPSSEISGGIFTPDLRLVITLAGISHIQFASGQFRQDATRQPKAAFLAIAQDEQGWKSFAGSERLSELVIFISQQWLAESGLIEQEGFHLLQHFSQQHLNTTPILANQRILSLAKQLKDAEAKNIQQRLALESALLALLAESFAQLLQTPAPNGRDYIKTFTEQLENGKFDHCSLAEMARQCYTNVTSLQRDFQQVHQISIGHYLRRHKLERAYHALLQGHSVTAAAEIAGYSNPDNFSTAFRRHFALTPRQVKQTRQQALAIL